MLRLHVILIGPLFNYFIYKPVVAGYVISIRALGQVRFYRKACPALTTGHNRRSELQVKYKLFNDYLKDHKILEDGHLMRYVTYSRFIR